MRNCDYRACMEQQAETYAWYIIENEATVRSTAESFNCSKSKVFDYVTGILFETNSLLALEVRKVLEKNKKERHLRGGMATKRRYELMRQL